MDFTVTYRESSGRLGSKIFSAVNRTEAVKILKEQGFSAVKIQPLKDSTISRTDNQRSIIKFIIVGAIAMVGSVCYFLFNHLDQSLEEPKLTPVNTETTRSIKIKQKLLHKETRKLTPDEKRLARKAAIKAKIKPLVRKDIVERPDGSFLYTDSKGRRICCLEKHEIVDERNRFRSPFKHKVEAYLSNFAIPGQRIPPMPPMRFSLDELRASLSEPITIDMSTDSDELIIKKQNVEQLKGFLKESLEQGLSFDEFVGHLQEQQRKEAMLVQESKRIILETLESGNPGEARELLNALNRNLNDNGIPNLRLPAKYRKMIDRSMQQ